MAIFGQLNTRKIAQVCDCVRLDASQTLISHPDVIDNIETVSIAPNGVDFVEIKALADTLAQRDWYLDWVYEDLVGATDGVFSPVLRITATEGRTITKSTDICILTEEQDKLFSCDQDLSTHEQDIVKFLPTGFCNWNHMHRRAQTVILEWFDDNGYTLKNCEKVTKDNVLVKSELREWSTYKTLELIFESQSNALDDIFREKAKYYEGLAARSRHQYHRGIDWNNNGEIDKGEEKTHEISSTRLLRR